MTLPGSLRYARSLRDVLGAEEAKQWLEKAIDREVISQRMREQGADARARHSERERQLAAMSDKALAAEVRRQSQAQWRPSRLLEHVKEHQGDYAEFFGRPVGPREVEETSKLVLASWDRLFTSIEPDKIVSYTFAADWVAGKVLLTVTRTGTIRTMIASKNFPGFLGRHPELVEVTERVRRIGV